MTRKDFELVAAVVAGLHLTGRSLSAPVATAAQIDGIAQRFADALATTNTAFDRAKFLRACLS